MGAQADWIRVFVDDRQSQRRFLRRRPPVFGGPTGEVPDSTGNPAALPVNQTTPCPFAATVTTTPAAMPAQGVAATGLPVAEVLAAEKPDAEGVGHVWVARGSR